MSKYQPLSDRLSELPDDEWRVTFAELEAVLGFPLPKGARNGAAWWANDTDRGHSRSWTRGGWEVAEVDRLAETVIFRRNRAAADIEAAAAAEMPPLPPVGQPEPEPAPAGVKARKAAPFVAAGVAAVAVMGGLAALFVRMAGRRSRSSS